MGISFNGVAPPPIGEKGTNLEGNDQENDMINIPSEPTELPQIQRSDPYTSLQTDILDQQIYTETISFLVSSEAKFTDWYFI